MPKKLKIAVYAISKNESTFVDRWVDSMSEADEIVVLDTGSIDNTVQKLKNRGVKVVQQFFDTWNTFEEYEVLKKNNKNPWRFDIARNISMSLVSNDVDFLVCTDLDEVLCNEWRKTLESKILEQFEKGNNVNSVSYRYIWKINPDGTPFQEFTYSKIHAKDTCKWTHPVHEILSYANIPKNTIYLPEIVLEHHPDPAKSRGSYLKLLELSVHESPNDDRNVHYLGREYMFHKEYEKAIETLKRHLSLPTSTWNTERAASMQYIARCYANLNNTFEAIKWFKSGIYEDPFSRECAIALAEFAYKNVQVDKNNFWWITIIEAIEFTLKYSKQTMNYLTRNENWKDKPYDLLSLAYWYTGQKDKAISTCEQAIKLASDKNRLIKNLELMKSLF